MFAKRVLSLVIITVLSAMSILSAAESAKQGVYEYVIQKSDMNFDAAAQALAQRFNEGEFRLLTAIDMAAYNDCGYRTRVFVVHDSAYSAALLQANRLTAPFASTDRINLFEDESGLHVSIVNPLNVHRTILMEDEKYNDVFKAHRQALRSAIIEVVSGEAGEKQYGQFRDKGYIGKTMGVMAGGPFDGKIRVVAEKSGDFDDVVDKLQNSLAQKSDKWGLHVVYTLKLNDDLVVFGCSGAAMESKSFSIVKAGADKSRKGFKCPGIAHAGAYPIEVVVVNDNGVVKVQLTDMMYRMKMYFEDAGKMAFMKNMSMPGSLAKELEAQVKAAMAE